MRDRRITFDGLELLEVFQLKSIEWPALPAIEPAARSVPGRDGDAFLGARLLPLDIKVTLRLDAGSRCPIDIADAWAELVPSLFAREPRRLAFDNGKSYMAQLVEDTPLEHVAYYGEGTLTFRCYDPIAYGASMRAEVPSGGSASVIIGGTYPTYICVSAESAVRSPSTGVWGLRVETGDFCHVPLPTQAASSVSIDGAEATALVNGSPVLPTITSDWLRLDPGEHVIRNDQGSGACTVSWDERWLR